MNPEAEWMEHKYLYTYRIANRVQAVARNPFAYLHFLEALTLDLGILEFVPHWQKDSALHKFIRYVADAMLEDDNCGDHKVPFGEDPVHPRWTIPIELAFVTYGIREEVEFEIPKVPKVEIKEGNTRRYEESTEVLDACYEHFWWLRLTQDYEDLLLRLSEEVFLIMFMNRAALQGLHEYLALHIGDPDMDWLAKERPDLARFFTKSGRMRRTRIPEWARRAIFYRDRGRCMKCKKDISRLVDTFNVENYDHIVPLAKGGLNCVTNLQLLCEACNKGKSDRSMPASESYRRWY